MSEQVLELYSPHSVQLKFHESKKRFRVISCGRQMGKSTMLLNEILRQAWEHPATNYWFVAPTFPQAKVQYRRMASMLFESPETMLKKNQSELRIRLRNQSQIQFVSGEQSQNLRGETLNGVCIDEVRDQSPELFSMIISPMLRTTGGWAAFASTPNGFDFFYDMASEAKINEKWEFITAPSTANPLFSQAEFELAKSQMSDAVFAQEIMAEFRDLSVGKAYYAHSVNNQRIDNPFAPIGGLISSYKPIIVACDFNLNPMAWTLMQTDGLKMHAFDEIHLERSNTQEAALELVNRIKALPIKSSPMVKICGDATSKAGQRAAAGKSDYSIIEQILDDYDITFINDTPESNPAVKDRVNTFNSRLLSSNGQVAFTYNPVKCKYLARDLDRVSWKKGTSMVLDQTTDPMLTHHADGVGYAICKYLPIQEVHATPTIRVIPPRF